MQKNFTKYLPKFMKPNTFIYVYYEIHYEIWAVLHHLEGKIVFRSKMSMKWIFALKNSQNVYFHSKTHSASAVTRSGDDWTQVQSKHKGPSIYYVIQIRGPERPPPHVTCNKFRWPSLCNIVIIWAHPPKNMYLRHFFHISRQNT